MKVNSNLKLLVILIIAVLLIAGCSNEKNTAQEPETQKLKIGALPIEDILPIVVADKSGYFAEENLEVELVPFQSAVESESAMQSGQLDGMVTDIIVATLLRDSGFDTRITSITLGASPQEGRFAIVAAPESNIETISDLKGKSIAISNNSIIEYVTDGLLKEADIEPSQVNKTAVAKIPVRLEMLLNNKIDTATLPDPLVTFAEFKGAKIIAEDTKKNLSQAVIIMTEKALEAKKEAIKGFYRAYAKAVNDINAAPEEFREILVENINIPKPIVDIYSIQHYPKPQLPQEKDINNVLDWLNKKELLKNNLKYEELVQDNLY
ncbi:MAG: NitT/TauT family transport system substrate-binding protein [Clostridia bacterium]|nr:lipoprotein [Clostridiales bacterium]MDK2985387.1 NitT/TauT family transport system substrate-binding protein [Clostridia bacterium]